MRTRAVIIHILQALAEGALIALLVVGLMAGTAFAARGGSGSSKPHGGGGTTATISVPDGVYGTTDVATVSPAGLWVKATCSQGGLVVYGQYVQSDANGHATLQLGPTSWWSGGSATCTAEAGGWSARNGQWAAQGSTTFNVAGQ